MHGVASVGRITRARATLSPALGLVVLVLSGPPAEASTPSPFVTVTQPISVGATTHRVLATRFCSDRILSINQQGAISAFADLPSTGNKCLARDLVISPGLGGFPAGHVFAVQKQTIYRIPPRGGTVRAFVTIPSLPNSESSLTFDTVGTFGFDLIVTGRLGEVWRVSSAGGATLVVDVGDHVEGPAVAPISFAPFGGQILATNDFTNSVFAIASDGTITPVATYDSPESVVFVPQSFCEFGSTGGVFFVASQFGNTIYKFPASDFTGLQFGRDALVLTKAGKIGLLTTVDGSIVVSDFEPDPIAEELESGTFSPCT